jgi:hypothetical protein
MTLTNALSRLAVMISIAMTVASAQAPRGRRPDAPRHIAKSARDEGWTRRLRLTEARRAKRQAPVPLKNT